MSVHQIGAATRFTPSKILPILSTTAPTNDRGASATLAPSDASRRTTQALMTVTTIDTRKFRSSFNAYCRISIYPLTTTFFSGQEPFSRFPTCKAVHS